MSETIATPVVPEPPLTPKKKTAKTVIFCSAAVGALFIGEFFYRHWRYRRYVGLPTDRFMMKLFPPLEIAPGEHGK